MKIPGVGLPMPSLPEGWRAHWCPQLKPDANYTSPPEAVAAGWNWRRSCPQSGWTGWFAEHFPRTVAALRCGWEEDRWGTRQSHDGNPTLLEFEYAVVFLAKDDPVFRSSCYLASDVGRLPVPVPGGGSEPPPIGAPVEVLIGEEWTPDEVQSTAGGRTLKLVSGRRPGGRLLLLTDEGRTWRRVLPTIPPPEPPTMPPPVLTGLPPLSPASQRVEELRVMLMATKVTIGPNHGTLRVLLEGAVQVVYGPTWRDLKPMAIELLKAFRLIRKTLERDPRPLPD